MSLDLAPAILAAIKTDPAITGLLSVFQGEPAISTRRPIDDDMVKPFILITPDVAINDDDALTSIRPIVIRDIIVYGNQPDDYRTVEQIGYRLRDLFHRKRDSIIPTGFDVIAVTATGPRAAPTSDDETVGRVVSLTIQLRSTT